MLGRVVSGSAKQVGKSTKAVIDVYRPSTWREKNWLWRIALLLVTFLLINAGLMFYWSVEPKPVGVAVAIERYAGIIQPSAKSLSGKTTQSKVVPAQTNSSPEPQTASVKGADAASTNPAIITFVTRQKELADITGVPMTAMTVYILDTLLEKRGGFLSNDVFPASLALDNIPNWEAGVLKNLRGVSKLYRNNFATSGSQSTHDKALTEADAKLSYAANKWALPSAESGYQMASEAFKDYLTRIADENAYNAQFYARADNLKKYLSEMSTNLGSYSQYLGASVGTLQKNTALSGDTAAKQSSDSPQEFFHKTPWSQIDNNFYEARGYCWATLLELRAMKKDFRNVLEEKNAMPYFEQIILELEGTQNGVWSPVILNGDGFGFVANHSLVMASYISRANAAMIDLINLLPEKG